MARVGRMSRRPDKGGVTPMQKLKFGSLLNSAQSCIPEQKLV